MSKNNSDHHEAHWEITEYKEGPNGPYEIAVFHCRICDEYHEVTGFRVSVICRDFTECYFKEE